jgi:hypothetical protein
MCFEEEAMLMSFVNSHSVEIDAQEWWWGFHWQVMEVYKHRKDWLLLWEQYFGGFLHQLLMSLMCHVQYKIAVCQVAVTSDKGSNIAHARSVIEASADKGAQLIVLPVLPKPNFVAMSRGWERKRGQYLLPGLLSEVRLKLTERRIPLWN